MEDKLISKIKEQIGIVKLETIMIDGAVNAVVEKYGAELGLPDEVINMTKLMTNVVESVENLCENVIALEMETHEKAEKIEKITKDLKELLDRKDQEDRKHWEYVEAMLRDEQSNKRAKENEKK